MHKTARTIDDLMNEVLRALLARKFDSTSSKGRGAYSEIIGALLHLKNPRARLSRSETRGVPFSALGELLWYLSGSNELSFIKFYIPHYQKESDDNQTVYGGYGPRLLNLRGQHNQIENVINLLKNRPSSRRAVIQLYDGADIAEDHKEIPCTCTLQFIIRKGKLHLFTSMRSNDAYIGLPHDIFVFTMLQEIFARRLNVKLGEYHHAVGSLHLYLKDKKKAKTYLSEGFQPTKVVMPHMPHKDIVKSIQVLLNIEVKIRSNQAIEMVDLSLSPYWSDLARLIEVRALLIQKNNKNEKIKAVKNVQKSMSSSFYSSYINNRIDNIK